MSQLTAGKYQVGPKFSTNSSISNFEAIDAEITNGVSSRRHSLLTAYITRAVVYSLKLHSTGVWLALMENCKQICRAYCRFLPRDVAMLAWNWYSQLDLKANTVLRSGRILRYKSWLIVKIQCKPELQQLSKSTEVIFRDHSCGRCWTGTVAHSSCLWALPYLTLFSVWVVSTSDPALRPYLEFGPMRNPDVTLGFWSSLRS